jgi:D-glycero-alpha-D-manno-heptose 1-phosphate guanylyltransferase
MSQVQDQRLCIILAGGLGTRLRSAIGNLPKCLAPVGRHTFLELQIRRLLEAGVSGIVLSLGHGASAVIEAVSRMQLPAPLKVVQESKPLGTGGAISHTLDTLGLEEVLVTNGDTFLDGELSSMLRPLDRGGGELLRMATVTVPDRSRFGGVIADPSGVVKGFVEKGQSAPGLINAGLYRLCRQALPEVRGSFSLEQSVLPELVAQGRVRLVQLDGSFIDIGVPDDYQRFRSRYGN